MLRGTYRAIEKVGDPCPTASDIKGRWGGASRVGSLAVLGAHLAGQCLNLLEVCFLKLTGPEVS